MRRGVIGLLVLFSFSLLPAYSATPPKVGAACSKQGISKTYQGKKFTCIKSGKKLVWSKGVVVKKPIPTPTPSPTPTPTPSPTPTQASNPSPSKTLDPKYPRQGQPCLRNSQDVIGYDDTGLLVDLMCNQFDDHYFPRPRDQKPFEVDQITGLRIKPKFNELLDVSNVQFKNITENSWNEALALKTSNYEPPQFFVDPNFNRTTAEGIKSATLEVLKHFTTYINRQIPIYSILSTSKNFENSTIQNNEILSLLANQSNGVIASQDKAYETLKTSSYGSALTFQIFKNNEVVAIGQVYRFNESTTGSFSDFAVGSHETMHAIQYMVIPDLSQVPMWFIEGQATQVGDIFQRTNQTLDDIATVLRASPFPKGSNDLRNFESYAGMDCCGLAYSRGMAANTYLTGKYGWDSMINFMNFVGRDNMDWKLAFQKAFGLSIINFYSDVQDYISWLSSP